jgi:tungstate transport system substrate-binding protein
MAKRFHGWILLMAVATCTVATAIAPVQAESVLMMATTTSTDDTGLLGYVASKFKEASGIELRWTATGTGKALKLGENCDVDVLLVHAPAAEKKFMADGFGAERREVMYNDFIVIGPVSDPAGLKGKKVVEALKIVNEKEVNFVSRGDDSGTHKTEQGLWKEAGLAVPDKAPWYIQAGQGMIATINIAAERSGYTLTDRGTFIKYTDNLGGKQPLAIIIEGDQTLLNQYSVITLAPQRCAKAKHDLAKKFMDWMASPAGQKAIGEFTVLGKTLFTPNSR